MAIERADAFALAAAKGTLAEIKLSRIVNNRFQGESARHEHIELLRQQLMDELQLSGGIQIEDSVVYFHGSTLGYISQDVTLDGNYMMKFITTFTPCKTSDNDLLPTIHQFPH